jgi:hypothetical protein
VAAAADRHFEVQLAGKGDRIDDIGRAGAAGDQGRPFVHQAVVDFPCILVAGIGRLEHLTAE